MNGADFYALAQSLAHGVLPAERRSATSRAYYGAFHTASELLEVAGISLPHGPECHKNVRWILDNSGDSEVVAASGKLSSLRIDRNHADYDLSRAAAEVKKTVDRHLLIAKEVMDCIAVRFSGEQKDDIRKNVRNYAKTALRLIVS